MKRRRIVLVVLIAAALLATGLTLPRVFSANGLGERLANGNFEEGFGPDGVAIGWHRFDNGGAVSYGWYDETWSRAVYEGKHAQLIEINSWKWFPTDPDRYAGIYQTVSVVPGATYQLVINAMMRTTEANPITSGYGYRVQYGIDYGGGTNWQAVSTWQDIGLNEEWERTNPGTYFTYVGTITATSNRLTLFIRGWKKWAQPNREFDLDIDAVSLRGTTPTDTELPLVSFTIPPYPMVGQIAKVNVYAQNDVGIIDMTLQDNGTVICTVSHAVGVLTMEHDCDWIPGTAGPHVLKATVHDAAGNEATFTNSLIVGNFVEFLVNGSFEGGFGGGVGNAWTGFNNGGRANFGFHDETWLPAVYDGSHGQLLEINTLGMHDNDGDRYVGIYQKVNGLMPGASYLLTINGMMRTTEADPVASGYGYRVQFGIDYSGGTNWQAVTNWTDVGFNAEYPRLSPGPYSTFQTWITAPNSSLTIFIRGWKKWPKPFVEFDLDLDG